jgi:hypothetical protein
MIFTAYIIYILVTIYLFLIPFTIYEYNRNFHKVFDIVNELELTRKKLEDYRTKLKEENKVLKNDRQKLKDGYRNLEIDREKFVQSIKKYNSSLSYTINSDITMWTDEEDWSDNNIEDIDKDDFYGNTVRRITLPKISKKR